MHLSVLMATWNRASRLEQTLRYFSALDTRNFNWELIIVANACTDTTHEVVSHASEKLPIVALEEPIQGKSRALNKALDVARGKLLVFTDDDVVPEQNWLQEFLIAASRWPDDGIFSGRINPLMPPETPYWMREKSFHFSKVAFAEYHPADKEGPVAVNPHGPNFAVRAATMQNTRFLESIGANGQNFPMGEETELIRRLRIPDRRCIYVPTASVNHVIESHQVTLEWLLGRAQRYGRGFARLNTDRNCPYLFNVPRYLWRQVGIYWMCYALNYFQNDEDRFKTGYPLYVTRGQIQEYRLMGENKTH